MSNQTLSRRLALVLEYDGSRYGGSQIQKSTPSIQGEVEETLLKLTGQRPRVAFAGRTDAGVHARGQIVAFTTTSALKTDVFVRGLNAQLPEEIAIRKAMEVPETFDPRRHASGRTYRYDIYNALLRSPLRRDRAWHVTARLDEAGMREAAAELIGERDFAAFSRREGVSTVRCVRRCCIKRLGEMLTVEMEANAFLRHQVRRTVGALVQVGRGSMSVSDFRGVLLNAEPASAGPVAPAHGLYLVRVDYPGLDLCGRNTLS